MCGQSCVYNTYATLPTANPLFMGFSCSQNVQRDRNYPIQHISKQFKTIYNSSGLLFLGSFCYIICIECWNDVVHNEFQRYNCLRVPWKNNCEEWETLIVDLPFTRDTWHGRMMDSRSVMASMDEGLINLTENTRLCQKKYIQKNLLLGIRYF